MQIDFFILYNIKNYIWKDNKMPKIKISIWNDKYTISSEFEIYAEKIVWDESIWHSLSGNINVIE